MRLMLSGGAGFQNSGDEALLLSATRICRLAFPRARLILSTNNEALARRNLRGLRLDYIPSPRFAFFRNDDHYRVCDREFQERWNLLRGEFVGRSFESITTAIRSSLALDFIDRMQSLKFMEALKASDLLVIHGGGILTSPTRSRLWEQALTIEIASSLGKKVMLRSHQVGPFDNAEDLERMRTILLSARFFSTRDLDESSRWTRALVPGLPVYEAVDDALRITTKDGAHEEVLRRNGLVSRHYIAVSYRHGPHVGMLESAGNSVSRVIALAQTLFDQPVLLLPSMPADVGALKNVARSLTGDIRLSKLANFLWDPIYLAMNARVVISAPHHPLIFALKNSVPIVSPVMGPYYLSKNIGSMRFFGLENQVIDLSEDLKTVMNHAEKSLVHVKESGDTLLATLARQRDILIQQSEAHDAIFRRAGLL